MIPAVLSPEQGVLLAGILGTVGGWVLARMVEAQRRREEEMVRRARRPRLYDWERDGI